MPTKPFLYDYQMDAVNHMFNGCILNGGVGSGKVEPDYITISRNKVVV